MEYKLTGIILLKRDVGETDRIYTIYTKEKGKMRVLAKGVKKPQAKLAGFLENFTLAEIFIVRKQGLGKITGSIVEDGFCEIKKDPDTSLRVFKNIKMLDSLTENEEKDENIFQLLFDYLKTINILAKNGKDSSIELVHLGFIFKLFDILGYKLEAQNCVVSGDRLKSGDNYFSSRAGGVVCGVRSAKEDMIKISDNGIKILRIFFQNNIKSLIKLNAEKKDIACLSIISDNFYRWIKS